MTKETMPNHEYVLNFKLSQDLKKIVNINIERINKIITEINTGTVTNPKFETQIKKEYLVKGNCEMEYEEANN